MEHLRRAVRTSRAPQPVGAYSQAVTSVNLVFTAGQIGISPETGLMAVGIEEQTRQALSNLEEILMEAGTGLDGIIKVNLYITDMSDFGLVNAVYSSRLREPFPARSLVEVSRLPLDALIEIEAVATIRRRKT